jgi:hypothetical protein
MHLSLSSLRVLRASVRDPLNAGFFSHRDTKNTKIFNASIPLIPPCSPCLRERPIHFDAKPPSSAAPYVVHASACQCAGTCDNKLKLEQRTPVASPPPYLTLVFNALTPLSLRVPRASVRDLFNAWFSSHRDTKNTKISNASILLPPPCSPCLRERPAFPRERPIQRRRIRSNYIATAGKVGLSEGGTPSPPSSISS